MVIPCESNIVPLYIQIASSTDADWNPRKTAFDLEVEESAKEILQPYSIQCECVEWYSVYPVGQALADKYTLNHRVFLAGHASHKAGQDMDTAFLDAQNLAGKVYAIESGFGDRRSWSEGECYTIFRERLYRHQR